VLQFGVAFAEARTGVHAMDERGAGEGVEVQLPSAPSMTLNGGERSRRFIPGKEHLFPTEVGRLSGPKSRFGIVSR
jgi:hypothetical protein